MLSKNGGSEIGFENLHSQFCGQLNRSATSHWGGKQLAVSSPPIFTGDDGVDAAAAYFVLPRKVSLGTALGVRLSNLPDLHFGEKRFGMMFAMCGSALRNGVCHICSMRSKEQVIGPNTSRLVTTVEYIDFGWWLSKSQCVTKAMGGNTFLQKIKLAIAVFQGSPSPKPAGSQFGTNDSAVLVHFRPETLGVREWALSVGIPQCKATATAVARFSRNARWLKELFSAANAGALNWHLLVPPLGQYSKCTGGV